VAYLVRLRLGVAAPIAFPDFYSGDNIPVRHAFALADHRGASGLKGKR